MCYCFNIFSVSEFALRVLTFSFSLPLLFFNAGNGYYLFLESSSPATEGDTASLLSKTFPGNSNVCLSFHYNMYGEGMGTVAFSIEVSRKNTNYTDVLLTLGALGLDNTR